MTRRTFRRTAGRRFLAALLATLVALALVGSAAAQSLTLELGVDRRDRPVLTSKVTNADGSPVTRAEVAFFLLPDFFPNEGSRINGLHPVPFGTDTTDATGTAERRIDPPYSGEVDIEARLLDAEGDAVASTRATFELVREGSPQPAPIEPPLAGVRRPIEITILAAVAAVWILLIAVFAGTLVSIRRLGRDPPAQPSA